MLLAALPTDEGTTDLQAAAAKPGDSDSQSGVDTSSTSKTSESQRKAETSSKADIDALEKHLGSKMLKEFQYQRSDLQRNAKHDERYARKEGKQALEEMQDEYAQQERQLVHDFKKMIP